MAKKNENKAQKQLFKKSALPKMPEGYYSGNKPNPNLRAFVDRHLKARPYDPIDDDYNVSAFSSGIQATKVDPIYNLHPYDSKKSHAAISEYIKHYCMPGDLVLDPFAGSGSTLVAASTHGCLSIGIDFSPLSTLICSEAVRPVDIEALQVSFDKLAKKVKATILGLYSSRCSRCGGPALIMGSVISESFQCVRCLEIVPYYSCIPTDSESARLCPICHSRGVDSVITTSFDRHGGQIVEVAYECHGKCKPRRAKRSILDKESSIHRDFALDVASATALVSNDTPAHLRQRMLGAAGTSERWGLLWRPYLRGFDRVMDFFTPRNLKACVILLEAIKESQDNALLIALSSILAKSSHLMAQNPDGIGRVMKGTYYVGALRREVNVWEFYEEAFKAVKEAKEAINAAIKAPTLVSCQSSSDLSAIQENSVDYVFTDPPYSGKVQFGELNFLREAFLDLGTSQLQDEIIVNEERDLSEDTWADRMLVVAKQLFRVLKPGRWLTLCYHDTSEGTWALVQNIMENVGFVSDNSEAVVFIETRQKSIKQITADKVNKRDLVINFRKPKPGEDRALVAFTGLEDARTFSQKARAIIYEFIQASPGSTKDRVYDVLVSRMVRKGQMEVHNFDELLRQVADEVTQPVKKNLFENEDPNLFGTHEIRRWYLKETADEADGAETAREDAAAKSLAHFIEQAKKDDDDGVHYSDLFEHFIYAVKDKPRRQLADWLPDYFFKTQSGTWRLPASSEEEQIKAQGRQSGLTRKVRRYVSCIEAGLPISSLPSNPSNSDLAEWIRHCKRSGLYAQGKILFEKGSLSLDQLPEAAQVNVEEDYQVCVRMLSRETVSKGTTGKRGRKAAEKGELR